MTPRRSPLAILRNRRRRGLSFTEMMISVGIFSVIGVAVAYIVLLAARASHDGLQFMRSEQRVRLVLDNVRRETLVGQFMTAEISDNGRTITFVDPVANTRARMSYAGGSLSYYPNVDDPKRFQWHGLRDVVFTLRNNGALLSFSVTAPARDWRGNSKPITLTDEVMLRNIGL